MILQSGQSYDAVYFPFFARTLAKRILYIFKIRWKWRCEV